MRTVRFAIALVLGAFLLTGMAAVLAQQADLDRELEEAKALYREAKFVQALAKLQEIITRMKALQDLQVRKAQLADAYLHLALSYLALNDPLAAKDALKQMLRLDRDRRLDPEVYAPKVIELFEQARAEVATEPAPTAQVPAKPAPAGAETKRKSSRWPYVLIGAGGAAAGGIAAASGSKDSGPAGASSSGSTTTTSTPPLSGQGDIVFLGSNPPPGGTISRSRNENISMMFSVVYPSDLQNVDLHVELGYEFCGPFCGQNCWIGVAGPFALFGNQPRTIDVVVPAELHPGRSCGFPTATFSVGARVLRSPAGANLQTFILKTFEVSYTINP